jgi:hypothetical protein
MSLTNYIEDLLPGWARAESRPHLVGIANTIAMVVDGLIDGLYDGRLAMFPGQSTLGPALDGFWSMDGLPLIGRDRRIVQGFVESSASYASRLRQWLASWRAAGTARGLLKALRGVMNPNPPRLRAVTASGTWYTLETDGTFRMQTRTGTGFVINTDGTTAPDTGVTHPWDFDSASGVVDPYRLWIIVDAPAAVPLNGTEGTLGDSASFYGDPGMTIGTTATAAYVEMIRGIVAEWKPAGVTCPWIIINFDPTAFNPLTPGPYPAAGMPDGTWHNHGKVVSGVRVATRFARARYWKGPL